MGSQPSAGDASASPNNKKPGTWIALLVLVMIILGGAYYLAAQDSGTSTDSAATSNFNEANKGNTAITNNVVNNGENSSDEEFSIVGQTTASVGYTSSDGTFSFQPPPGLYIISIASPQNWIEFNRNKEPSLSSNYIDSFMILKTSRQTPPQADGVDLLLDAKPSTIRAVDSFQANIYEFPSGYEGTPAFVVVRVNVHGLYYQLEFWNTKGLTPEIEDVLDSLDLE